MSDKSQQDKKQCIADFMANVAPATLFIVGDLPQSLCNTGAPGVSVLSFDSLGAAQHHVTQLATSDAADQQSGDAEQVLILKLDPAESQFEHYLGHAIRAFPQRVLLHCTSSAANAGRRDEEFFAFGFRKLPVAADDSGLCVRWFEYRLSQYKPAPDWLNAQFWANPERFDLDDDLDDYDDEDE
ncbi:MAG: DUF6231 family protein [Granulosicoccus sp.]